MKLLAAALVGLLSVVSATYTPADARRAREFYKGLVLTEMSKYDTTQRTQLALHQVGARVCTAYDDYAVFDFQRLDDDTPGAAAGPDGQMTKQIGDSLYIVYQVCGAAFAADLGDVQGAVEGADNGCARMASGDTHGNMYLVRDGACVQSFLDADFNATVEQVGNDTAADATSTIPIVNGSRQEWDLTYTSLQDCGDQAGVRYVVDIHGVCAPDGTAATMDTTEVSDCKATLEYRSHKACYIQYIPLQKYMAMVAPFSGAVFIVVGLVMCFYGSRFLPFMIAFLVGVIVGGFIAMVGYNFLDPEKAQLWHLVVLLLVALAFGVLAGYCAWTVAYDWAVAILSFWLGILLAILILKTAEVENQNITLIAAGVGGLLGAWLGSKYNHGIKKLGTGIIGAFLLVRGVAVYVGNFPSEFSQGVPDLENVDAAALLQADDGNQLVYTIGYLVGFIILACAGFIFQQKVLPEEQKDEAFGDEDEAKVCGCL